MPYYPNAPITEAIIDLRVTFGSGLDFESLGQVPLGDDHGYPKKERIFGVTGELEVRPGVSTSASAAQEALGFKFTSDDGKRIWQSRATGFTFSRLAPYLGWEPFEAEARRLWQSYREHTKPTEISRVAVRFINRIDVPAESIELKDYFRTFPEVSPKLPQRLHGFFLHLIVPHEDLSAAALINQAMVPPGRDGVTSVVLDVDLFRAADVPQDEASIWGLFELLRRRKNDIFEACITDHARELFR